MEIRLASGEDRLVTTVEPRLSVIRSTVYPLHLDRPRTGQICTSNVINYVLFFFVFADVDQIGFFVISILRRFPYTNYSKLSIIHGNGWSDNRG